MPCGILHRVRYVRIARPSKEPDDDPTESAVKQQLTGWHLKRVPFPSVSYVTYSSADPSSMALSLQELREHELYQIRHNLLGEGFRKGSSGGVGFGPERTWANLRHGQDSPHGIRCDRINKDFGETFFGHVANWLALYVPV